MILGRSICLGECYLLAVPGHTLRCDLETPPTEYSGRGRRPKWPWQCLDPWSTSLAQEACTTIDVRDGATGPLVVEIVKGRVVARTPQRQKGHREMAVVGRDRDRDQQEVITIDFYLSNGVAGTRLLPIKTTGPATAYIGADNHGGQP